MLTCQNLSKNLNNLKDTDFCKNLLIKTDSTETTEKSNSVIDCKYLNSETSFLNTPSPSPPCLLLMKAPQHKKQSKFYLVI